MEKKKVLILYNKLFHYRIPIFNILAEKYDLTVIYSFETSEDIIDQCLFKTKFVPVKNYGKLVIHQDNIFDICKKFDVVIAYGDIKWLSYSSLVFRKRKFKLIFWSIGVPASYKRKYGEASKSHYYILDIFNKRADGLIFYSDFPIQKYEERIGNNQNFFVANNTVKVEKIEWIPSLKKDILFIGTLYFEKGLGVLLDAYMKSYKVDPSIPKLNIIGGGDQFSEIKNWIESHNLENKIKMVGPIYSGTKKSKYFEKSLACISPSQAGLSVLESMGYGVPFITMKGAITGGEAFNIKHNFNGLLLQNADALKYIILDININKTRYIEMGKNAFDHYWEKRKPEDMTRGIIEAIEKIS